MPDTLFTFADQGGVNVPAAELDSNFSKLAFASLSNLTTDGQNVIIALAGSSSDAYTPESKGAKGDAIILNDVGMTAGDNTIHTSHVFVAGDVNKKIWIDGAGANAPAGQLNYTLYTFISAVVAGVAHTHDNAINTVVNASTKFGTNDLPAFLLVWAEMQAAGVGNFALGNGKNYLWDTQSLLDGQTIFSFTSSTVDTQGFTFDFNDGRIIDPRDYRTTTVASYALYFQDYEQLTFLKYNLVTFQDVNFTTIFRSGLAWAVGKGISRVYVPQMYQRGGRQGFWFDLEEGDPATFISTALDFGTVVTENVSYPLEGYSSSGFKVGYINSTGAERTLFIDNGDNYTAVVRSKNHNADNIIMTSTQQTGLVVAGPWCLSNVTIDYTSLERDITTRGGYHTALVCRTGPGLPGSQTCNIKIRLNVNANAGGVSDQSICFYLYRQVETGVDSQVYVPDAAPGRHHKIDGIDISGTIINVGDNGTGGYQVIQIGQTFQADDDIRGIRIHDLTVRGAANCQITVDGTGIKAPVVLENIDTDGVILLQNFPSPDLIQLMGYGRAANMSWGGGGQNQLTANTDFLVATYGSLNGAFHAVKATNLNGFVASVVLPSGTRTESAGVSGAFMGALGPQSVVLKGTSVGATTLTSTSGNNVLQVTGGAQMTVQDLTIASVGAASPLAIFDVGTIVNIGGTDVRLQAPSGSMVFADDRAQLNIPGGTTLSLVGNASQGFNFNNMAYLNQNGGTISFEGVGTYGGDLFVGTNGALLFLAGSLVGSVASALAFGMVGGAILSGKTAANALAGVTAGAVANGGIAYN